MRRFAIGLILALFVVVGGCSSTSGSSDEKIKVRRHSYTVRPFSDRWKVLKRQFNQIINVVDIYAFDYDVTDPYSTAPFFGDPH